MNYPILESPTCLVKIIHPIGMVLYLGIGPQPIPIMVKPDLGILPII